MTKSNEKEKLKLVYILGTGHSGSTLLELTLSTAPGVFSVGGFRYLDRFVSGTHGIVFDDAGYKAQESPMWRDITRQSSRYILDKTTEPVLSFKNRLSILLTGSPTLIPKRYRNQDLYLEVQRKAEEILGKPVKTIVDSSKTLARLIEIKESTDFDLFVIHLIRDVRGVANSNRKINMPIFTSAKYWLTDNLYASAYLRKNIAPEKQMRIHYEQFAFDPEGQIELINKKIGLNIDSASVAENINCQTSYRFAGNKMRLQNFSGFKKDERWRTELPLFYRLLLAPLRLIFR